jgi:simple sugar transport system permease protein
MVSTDFFIAILRMSTPLILCSMGVLIVRKSGVVCIAFEAMMLASAFGGVIGSAYSGNLLIGSLAGLAFSVTFAVMFGYFVLVLKANNMLVSLALNALGSGGTVFLLFALTGDRGNTTSLKSLQFPAIDIPLIKDIPFIGEVFSGCNLMTYIALLSVPIVYLLLFKTSTGLRIRAVGENPDAAESLGTSTTKVRFLALIIAGILAGLAGMYMSMGYVSYFTRDMIAGRGFISIAAQNLGGSMPFATLIWSLVFGVSSAIANAFQSVNMPPEFLKMFPYLATIIGLAIVGITENRKVAAQKNLIQKNALKIIDKPLANNNYEKRG